MRPVIVDRNKVGWAVSAVYVRALGRYLVATQHTTARAGKLDLLEAPNP
jgi:hypothetical protein